MMAGIENPNRLVRVSIRTCQGAPPMLEYPPYSKGREYNLQRFDILASITRLIEWDRTGTTDN